MCGLDAGNSCRGRMDGFEAEHWPRNALDESLASVIGCTVNAQLLLAVSKAATITLARSRTSWGLNPGL